MQHFKCLCIDAHRYLFEFINIRRKPESTVYRAELQDEKRRTLFDRGIERMLISLLNIFSALDLDIKSRCNPYEVGIVLKCALLRTKLKLNDAFFLFDVAAKRNRENVKPSEGAGCSP